jgi:hypothetical protein
MSRCADHDGGSLFPPGAVQRAALPGTRPLPMRWLKTSHEAGSQDTILSRFVVPLKRPQRVPRQPDGM